MFVFGPQSICKIIRRVHISRLNVLLLFKNQEVCPPWSTFPYSDSQLELSGGCPLYSGRGLSLQIQPKPPICFTCLAFSRQFLRHFSLEPLHSGYKEDVVPVLRSSPAFFPATYHCSSTRIPGYSQTQAPDPSPCQEPPHIGVLVYAICHRGCPPFTIEILCKPHYCNLFILQESSSALQKKTIQRQVLTEEANK